MKAKPFLANLIRLGGGNPDPHFYPTEGAQTYQFQTFPTSASSGGRSQTSTQDAGEEMVRPLGAVAGRATHGKQKPPWTGRKAGHLVHAQHSNRQSTIEIRESRLVQSWKDDWRAFIREVKFQLRPSRLLFGTLAFALFGALFYLAVMYGAPLYHNATEALPR